MNETPLTIERARAIIDTPWNYTNAAVHSAAHLILTTDETSEDERWQAAAVTSYE